MDIQNPVTPTISSPPQAAAPASTPVTPSGTTYTPPPSIPSPIQTAPTPPPSSHKGLLLLACVLLVLLLGGAGYLFMNMQQPKAVMQKKVMMKPSPTIKPTITPMASPSAMASDSANWKTYTSLDKTYTIQYPLDTFVRYICPNEELTLTKRLGSEKEDEMTMPTCARDGLYNIEVITRDQPPTPQQSDEYYSVTKKDITVGGVPAQQYTTTQIKEPLGSGISFSEDTYVPYKNKVYQLHVGSKDLLQTFDQMLPTFKFTK